MRIRERKALACSAVVIGVSWATMTASAQSLGLSYELGVRADMVERVTLPADHCIGPDRWKAMSGCSPEREAALLSSSEERAAVSARGMRRVTVGAAGEDTPGAIPRQALNTGEDSLDGRRRTADVSLRFGSKSPRLSGEENGDLGRFVDAPYEGYVHSNAHKTIGLELLVPFQ